MWKRRLKLDQKARWSYQRISGIKLKGIIDEIAPHVRIEVDGGVTDITGRLLKESGADIIVSASYIYGGNIRERIGILKNI